MAKRFWKDRNPMYMTKEEMINASAEEQALFSSPGFPARRMPNFKNAQEQMAWYNSLSPAEQRMITSPVLAGLDMNHPNFLKDYQKWIRTGALPEYALRKDENRAMEIMEEIDKPIFEE